MNLDDELRVALESLEDFIAFSDRLGEDVTCILNIPTRTNIYSFGEECEQYDYKEGF